MSSTTRPGNTFMSSRYHLLVPAVLLVAALATLPARITAAPEPPFKVSEDEDRIKKAGSKWEQTIVFPAGKRYFVSADRITTLNASDALFLRIDMPGHIKHKMGDSFSEVYLSYHGEATFPAKEFLKDFAPDEKFLY